MAELTIIVVNWNTRDLLGDCLASIDATAAGVDAEVVVVDNASSDGSPAMVRERFPQVQLIANAENTGFAFANNQAAHRSRAEYLLLLNSDARLQPGAVQALLAAAAPQPRVGAVGAQLRNVDDTFQASHAAFPTLASEFLTLSGLGRVLHGQWYPSYGPDEQRGARAVEWVSGACLLVRRAAFEAVGGFDEGYFVYAEEMDLCYRLRRAGWEVRYQPAARVVHVGGATSRRDWARFERHLYQGRVRFFRKHYGDLAAAVLKLELYAFTAVKSPMHALARRLTNGRRGRSVVPLRQLVTALRRE
jgi:hypothetical protein